MSKPVDPVVRCTSSDRLECISVAVVNPIGTILHATISLFFHLEPQESLSPSARILSAFASEIPLMVKSCFFGVKATASTVCIPAWISLSVSDLLIPASCLSAWVLRRSGARADLEFCHQEWGEDEGFILFWLPLELCFILCDHGSDSDQCFYPRVHKKCQSI